MNNTNNHNGVDEVETCTKNLSEVGSQAVAQASKKSEEGMSPRGLCLPLALTAAYLYALRSSTSTWTVSESSDQEDRPPAWTIFSSCSVFVPLVASVLYLAGIFIGKQLMKDRAPFAAKDYMFTYNLYQTLLNAWCVYSFIAELVKNRYPVWGNTIESTNFQISFLIWIHYNNKYVELLDTLFMVLRKKNDQLSFLHIYHHVLLIWAWWFVCHFACGGDAYFGAMMNSFIHVVMYSYYLLASLSIPCPWKKYITQLQMVQFVVCFFSALYCLVMETYPWYLCLIQLYVMVNMLVLFWNFYTKAYSNSSRRNGSTKTVDTQKKSE